jgi:hypothetical protein
LTANLPQTHAPAKLLIETGVITEAQVSKEDRRRWRRAEKLTAIRLEREGVGLAAQGDREKRATVPVTIQ